MRLIRTVWAVAAVLAATSAHGADFTFGNYNESVKTCAITAYTGDPVTLTIPDEFNRSGVIYKVTRVQSGVFNNLSNLKKVVIGKNLTSIGSINFSQDQSRNRIDNFFGCSALEKFEVNSSNSKFASTGAGILTDKDGSAIYRVPPRVACTDGTLNLSDKANKIYRDAFSGVATVKTLGIGKNMHALVGGGFNLMPNLSTFVVPDINMEYATVSTSGAAGEGMLFVLLDDGEAWVAAMARKHVTSKVTVPAQVKLRGKNYRVRKIADCGLANLKTMTSVSLPDGLKTLGRAAFAGSGLTSVTIGPGVECDIEGSTFSDCEALASVNVQAADATIPENFVRNCRALKKFTINGAPESIYGKAFKNCTSLTEFPFSAATALRGDSIFANTGFSIVKFDSGDYNATSESRALFTGCKNLTEINMGAVMFESDRDFYSFDEGFATNCPKLRTLIFPRNASLRPATFGINNNLKKIVVQNFVSQDNGVFGFNEECKPAIYEVTKNTWPDIECALATLLKPSSGTTLKPTVYTDAYTLRTEEDGDSEGPIANATYYVPGGTKENYTGYPDVRELYQLQITDNNGKARIRWTTTREQVTLGTINLGYGSLQATADGVIDTDVNFKSIKQVYASYKVNEVEMLTRYPASHFVGQGVGVEEIPEIAGPVSVYTLQGVKVADAADAAALDLPAGIYILVDADGRSRKAAL